MDVLKRKLPLGAVRLPLTVRLANELVLLPLIAVVPSKVTPLLLCVKVPLLVQLPLKVLSLSSSRVPPLSICTSS